MSRIHGIPSAHLYSLPTMQYHARSNIGRRQYEQRKPRAEEIARIGNHSNSGGPNEGLVVDEVGEGGL